MHRTWGRVDMGKGGSNWVQGGAWCMGKGQGRESAREPATSPARQGLQARLEQAFAAEQPHPTCAHAPSVAQEARWASAGRGVLPPSYIPPPGTRSAAREERWRGGERGVAKTSGPVAMRHRSSRQLVLAHHVSRPAAPHSLPAANGPPATRTSSCPPPGRSRGLRRPGCKCASMWWGRSAANACLDAVAGH